MNIQAFIDEIARDIYRINVAVPPTLMPGGFSFNQYLLVDEKPLLFHTGPRRMFGLISEQIEKVMPVAALRYVAFSHVEADECGSLAEFLSAAPAAQPVCSEAAAHSMGEPLIATGLAMKDSQVLITGRHALRWQSTPHLPHGWDCGYLFDETSRTLLCGDLFTQPGMGERALVSDDILAASETLREQSDDYAHCRKAPALLDKLAALQPETLACMHGSAWTGDGAQMLERLKHALVQSIY